MQISNKKGITLIALVITIIVLLILAGVSITMLTGNNSILNQATNAKQRTGEGTEAEQVKIAVMAAVADSTVNLRSEIEKSKLETELQKYFSGATVTEDGDDYIYEGQYKTYRISKSGAITEEAPSAVSIRLTLSNNNTPITKDGTIVGDVVENVPIPVGFHHVTGTEKAKGLVIESDDSTKNQFVWVPVDQGQTLTLTVTTDEPIQSIKLTRPDGTIANLNTTKEPQDIIMTKGGVEGAEYINGLYKVEVTTSESGTTTAEKIINTLYGQDIEMNYKSWLSALKAFNMITNDSTREEIMTVLTTAGVDIYGFTDNSQQQQSVEKYGGFYIARYEAGDGEASEKRIGSTEEHTVVSKKGAYVYNYVTRAQAITLAASMYNTTAVKSQLITGAGWDRTLNWLVETGMNEELLYDSKTWGNYSDSEGAAATNKGTLQTTGKNDAWQAKNIYDLAGNVWEWTTETSSSTDNPCVNRGGDYNNEGANFPASYCNGNGESFSNSVVGFRPSLYLVVPSP